MLVSLGSFSKSSLDIFSELNLHYIEKEEKERKYKILTTRMCFLGGLLTPLMSYNLPNYAHRVVKSMIKVCH